MKAVTIGYFDGVHKGHQQLINKVVDNAKAEGLQTLVYTFDLNLKTKQGLIMTLDEKISVLKQMGIDEIRVLNFQDIKEMTREAFVDKLREDTSYLAIGNDFRFGKNREGDVNFLRQIADSSFEVDIIEDYIYEDKKVSSSYIRDLIEKGNLATANELMFEKFRVSSAVVRGFQRGSQMGFPTANIIWPSQKIKPAYGVYFTGVKLGDQTYFGMTMTGIAKTFNDDFSCETNIFNFNKNIYGEKIELIFYEFLRKNEKFSSVDDLKIQLYKDKISCLEAIKNLYK